ncbi:hypothetical protein N656DRAFT_687407, partial [Canariomyces notabilis]
SARMANPDPIPPDQKARTMAHMNKDHREDMRFILLHYPCVPPLPAAYRQSFLTGHPPSSGEDNDPIMTDINLASFTVRLPGTIGQQHNSYSIPFNPPLSSWAERRTRLVEMTQRARAAVESSSSSSSSGSGVVVVVVNEYMPPRFPYDALIFGLVLQYFAFAGLVFAGWFNPGTVLGQVLDKSPFPYGRAGFVWLVRAIFLPVLGIHVAEAWWLERSRLSNFGVRRGSRVWWVWMGSVFVEGAMAFKRFDLVVER